MPGLSLNSFLNFSMYAGGFDENWLYAAGPSTNIPSKKSLAHWMQCSIAWGKFFKVQSGMLSSGFLFYLYLKLIIFNFNLLQDRLNLRSSMSSEE